MLLSLLSAVLLSLPWIGTSFSWTLFFALVPLLIVEDQLTTQHKSQGSIVLFSYALLTFLLWNVLSTWWIAYVSFGGMILISAINSFLMACVWWLAHLVRRRFAIQTGYFSLIVFWLTFEFLHFHWAIQWPWLSLGNGFSNAVQLIQWYEFTGVLGGSLWVILINVLLFNAFKCYSSKNTKTFLKLSATAFLLFALPAGGSLVRYFTYAENGKTIEVVVLQPNIDPYTEKFSSISSQEQTRRLISLAQPIVTDSTRFVLAPETSLSTIWEDENIRDNESLALIDSLIGKYPSIGFVAGAITQKKTGPGEPISYSARQAGEGYFFNVFNSALLIDHSPRVQVAHKNILVSGVEKMPFQKYFFHLGEYVVSIGGTAGSLSAGNQPSVFEGGRGEKIGSVICFESAFGGYVAGVVKKGANVIFLLTNDGWWKNSPGMRQHFAFARLRAVESRRSIVRSANTGISGFINERGEIMKETPVDSCMAVISPVSLNKTLTFYVTWGDYLGQVSLLFSVLIFLYTLFDFARSRR